MTTGGDFWVTVDNETGGDAGQPAWGQGGVGQELAKRGIIVSAASVGRICQRPRSDDDEASPEGARGKGRPGRPHLDGGAGRRTREGESRQGSARRVRERVPGLLRAQDTFYVGTPKC